MKLILVHGINQQDRSADELERLWTGWLRAAMPDPRPLEVSTRSVPFYGKVLDQFTRGMAPTGAVEQGAGSSGDADELAFIAEAMGEAATAANLSAREIAEEQRLSAPGAVEQSLLMNHRVNAVARLLEKVSPVHGRFVLPLIKQAYAYLRRPGVAPAIDAIVGPHLETGEPCVVVAHSLGTVVTFKLMRALAQAGRPVSCPLYVTLGSPLSLRAVSAALGVPFVVPPGVRRWVNAVEPGDVVTLGKPLDKTTFASGIENILDIANQRSDSPHDVEGYLSDRRIATTIEMALR